MNKYDTLLIPVPIFILLPAAVPLLLLPVLFPVLFPGGVLTLLFPAASTRSSSPREVFFKAKAFCSSTPSLSNASSHVQVRTGFFT